MSKAVSVLLQEAFIDQPWREKILLEVAIQVQSGPKSLELLLNKAPLVSEEPESTPVDSTGLTT